MPATRRARQRAATIEEIKEAALAQIAAEGAAALSIRGIARTIGMSPAGLYRYYDGLDELITELITDAYNDLADYVLAVTEVAGSPRDRFRDGMVAYRQWAVEHPNRFLLIFGTPIPGYAAPEEGPTVAANRRLGGAFFALGVEAWQRGDLQLPVSSRAPSAEEQTLAAEALEGAPADFVAAFLSSWAHFHGLVTLEVLHQLDWIYPDATGFFQAEIELIADRLMTGR
jgi:AcrR family transcriptional regulator